MCSAAWCSEGREALAVTALRRALASFDLMCRTEQAYWVWLLLPASQMFICSHTDPGKEVIKYIELLSSHSQTLHNFTTTENMPWIHKYCVTTDDKSTVSSTEFYRTWWVWTVLRNMASQAWRHTPLIPALGTDFWVWGQPGLQSEFQDSRAIQRNPILKTKQNKNPLILSFTHCLGGC